MIPRAPIVFFWVRINLLFFNISSQSQPGAVLEDSVNKPWRPLPSGRIKQKHVRHYIVGARLAILATGLLMGGSSASFMIQILTFCCNDLCGGERWLSRNLLNAGVYLSCLIGAMQSALGVHSLECSTDGFRWLCCIAATICCTMHIQDLYDQEGDRLRDRKTIPLVFGDSIARYTIAIPVLVSSFLAPAFWQLSAAGFLPSMALGVLVATRLVGNQGYTPRSDKSTFCIGTCGWSISSCYYHSQIGRRTPQKCLKPISGSRKS